MDSTEEDIRNCISLFGGRLWNAPTNRSLLQTIKAIPGLENEKITFDYYSDSKQLTVTVGTRYKLTMPVVPDIN